MKSILQVSQQQIKDQWYLVDVSDFRLGRAATFVAQILLGKLNPLVRPNLDPKTHVIVINVSKLNIPYKRAVTTFFSRYSGYPGGLKFVSLDELIKKDVSKAFEIVVKGMLPKNKRGKSLYSRLHVYNNESHPHAGQNPILVDIKNIKL
jgi:large subunit ribosomal protein L13